MPRFNHRKPLGRALLLGAAVAATPAALAATPLPAFDLERLHLSPAATDSLLVDTGRLLNPGDFRLALTVGYERGSLELGLTDGSSLPLVRDRVQAWLTGAWSPLPRLELSAQLPVTVWQGGQALGAVQGITTPASAGLGTPVLGARYALLRREAGAPVSLGVGLDVGLPGGTASALGRQDRVGGLQLTPRVAVGRVAGPVVLGANAGIRLRAKEQEPGRAVGSEVELAGTVATHGPGLRGELSVEAARSLVEADTAVELLAGARLPLPHGLETYAMVGHGFTDVPGSPSFRALLGVAWTHHPEPKVDPCEGGRAHRPDQCPALDDDGDGVANGQDACPLEAGPAANRGCPVKDTDGDGVLDDVDRCPAETGPASNHGCPVKDADKDGVPDDVDNCPAEPGPASNQGCPEKEKQIVKIEPDHLQPTRRITFENDRVLFKLGAAGIQGEGAKLLEQIAALLKAHPEIEHLRIEGHTDNTGPADLNRRLSQARAEAVRDYLIQHGIDGARLTAKGFGPDKPVATNDTPEGRQANRRVDFIIDDVAGER